MVQLMQPFDATQFDPTQSSGGNFPIGKHPVVIVGDEVKATKDNTGGMLVLTLEVIDGPHKGLTGAYRLNLYNQSEEAKRIANNQMSALCHVLQTYQVTDARQLYGKPFIIEVTPQKDPQYTEIKKVYDMNGNEPQRAGQGAAPAAPAPQTAPAAFQGAAPATPPAAAPAGQWAQPAAPAAAPAAGGGWQAPAAGQPAPAAPWGQQR